ncbi:putative metalloprotease CJM1_0395 family protein [Pseudomonas sp. LRF_L74]|uniref:putative metalloprotease CJM1_0395 family protein n=1 Tax=Pseudomonas sp. LRF_L74 TaxID=3369422 RepID=UPI003F6017CB
MQIGSVGSSSLLPQPYAWAAPTPASESIPAPTASQRSADADDSTSRDGQGGATNSPGQLASRAEKAQQQADLQELSELAKRDREVRAHEQAHAAVGGAHAGSPSYTYTRGPNGKAYATAGEVGIDVGAVNGDPQATIRKMEVVQRAALAPAEPSAQDRRVAAQAQARSLEAQGELAKVQREEQAEKAVEKSQESEGDDSENEQGDSASLASRALDLYRHISSGASYAPALDVSA